MSSMDFIELNIYILTQEFFLCCDQNVFNASVGVSVINGIFFSSFIKGFILITD